MLKQGYDHKEFLGYNRKEFILPGEVMKLLATKAAAAIY